MNTRSFIGYVMAASVACALLLPATALATTHRAPPAGGGKPTVTTIEGLKMVHVASGVGDEIKQRGGEGPDPNHSIRLSEVLNIPEADRILALNDEVYVDKKEDSGFYYYWPRSYSLAHDPDLGHLFRIRYGLVTGDKEADAGNVAVSFTLSGGWTKDDYKLLKHLLNKYLAKRSLPACTDLNPLPFHTCGFTFGAQAYGVGPEAISVPALSDIAGYMDVILTTDETTLESLKVALQDIQGLSGKVNLVTAAVSGEEDVAGFAIPDLTARVSLCDPRAYQRAPYVRNGYFENKHDFPVRLKNICFLVEDGDDVRLFEYDLDSTLVQPGKRAMVNHNRVHPALATSDNVIRGWYEYRLVGEAEDKDDDDEVQEYQEYWDKVMKRLTVGLGKKTVKILTVEVLDEDLFDEYGVALIKVKVRSKHFDPNSKDMLRKTYELDEDETEVEGDPLYFLEGEEEEEVSYFEYKIYMVDADGEVHADKQWRQGIEDDESIYIGANPFRELIGGPGDDDGDGDDNGDDE